jgi:hypothetical protein
MPVSRRLPKALQNETRVSMILSRTQILFGSELKGAPLRDDRHTAGFLDKNRAEQRRYAIAKAGGKSFQNFF